MPNWTWEPTEDGFVYRNGTTIIDVIGFDDGSWIWRTYHPWGSSETASGFKSADEAKADAERFFMMAEEE